MREQEECLLCPFCGAPQRRFIPNDSLQVKCEYCGGTFLVQPKLEDGRYRCQNHPDRVAIGFCNDCGKSFCEDCLNRYDLSMKSPRMILLYLCPKCLKRRKMQEAQGTVVSGIFLLLFGLLFVASPLLILQLMGVLFLFSAAAVLIYGQKEKKKVARQTFDA